MRSVSDRIRRDLLMLREAEQNLRETTAYDAMFHDMRASSPASDMSEVSAIIASAKRALVRNDRVVWFLRQWKIGKLIALRDEEAGDPGLHERATIALDKALHAYCARARIGTDAAAAACASLYGSSRAMLARLAHFVSLPVPAVQEVVFGYQPLDALVGELQAAESAWQTRVGDTLPFDPQDKLLIDCGQGYGWYDLGRASCTAEGKAMGHCGNLTREFTDDTLLSLRRLLPAEDGPARVRPYLTFVLGADGFLGEMKARANRSPAEAAREGIAPSDFAGQIAKLLRLPIVRGLRGGGYEAERNFKLADLPKGLRAALVDEKPELATVATLIDRKGETQAVGEHIEALFADGERNYRPVLRRGGREFVMEHAHSLDEVAYGMTPARSRSQATLAFSAWEKGREPDETTFMPTVERIASLLEALRDKGADSFHDLRERVADAGSTGSDTPEPREMAQALLDDDDLRRALMWAALAIHKGRHDYLREFGENYLLDWLDGLRPVANSLGVTLAGAVHLVTPRLGFESEILVTAPFATLAVIADRGWMDKRLDEVMAFEDGPAFRPDPARWSVDVAADSASDLPW